MFDASAENKITNKELNDGPTLDRLGKCLIANYLWKKVPKIKKALLQKMFN
jgi:hypothetical protein